MKVDNLSTFEQETLNRFLLHHMGMETRRKLMTEFPVIYRKLLGKDDDVPFRAAVKAAVLGDEGGPARIEFTRGAEAVPSADPILEFDKAQCSWVNVSHRDAVATENLEENE
jgi:hypothetical protein